MQEKTAFFSKNLSFLPLWQGWETFLISNLSKSINLRSPYTLFLVFPPSHTHYAHLLYPYIDILPLSALGLADLNPTTIDNVRTE